MEGRADWEVHAMYLTLAATLLYPALRSLEKAWHELLWLAAAAYCLLPLLNAFTTNRHLGNSVLQGDWIMAGSDLTALACGLVFAVFAVRIGRKVTVKATMSEAGGNKAELATS
jgi:hypothetical protein